MATKFRKMGHSPDYVIIFAIGFLVLFGLLMLASASSAIAQADTGDSLFYLKRQLMFGLGAGLIGFLITYNLYYGVYRKRWISTFLLVFSIFLLLATFSPLGVERGGATRWINLGGFEFQPSEILKIALVVYLAIWLTAKKSRQESFKEGYIPFVVVIGFISVLLFLQKSTSPVFILASVALIMYFMSGAKLRYIGLTILGGIAALALLVAVTSYRLDRITTFLNPGAADPQGAGYHINQAKTAIGSGGLTGVGYGQSVFSKVEGRLPEPFGDSIFAIIAEEFGFIGSILILSLFTVLVLRIFLLAKKARDNFAQLLLVGFGSLIGIQAVVNIGAMSGILPLTGAPLPFISYGGTALAVFMTIGGITANISKYT